MADGYFAFQRANGDWYMLEIEGRPCLPIFRTLDAARRAKARHGDLMVYFPVAVGPGKVASALWLVDDADTSADLFVGEWVSSPSQRAGLTESPAETTAAV